MFYETFKDLCKVKNIKPTHVVQELGLSSANMSNWKSGRNPKTDILKTVELYTLKGFIIWYLNYINLFNKNKK